MFIEPMMTTFSEHCNLVALLDIDPLRFEVCKDNVPQCKGVSTFSENEFDKMAAETRPDVIIVAGADYSHVAYVIAALEKDIDVIVEKPMTTNAADAGRIIAAETRSRGNVTVTFNFRYSAVHRKIKELLLESRVGRITSVNLNWYVDTFHGASYFKRWNRKRHCSGGLSVHKCSHHFDLLNWWLGQDPVEVFSYGALNYYGPGAEMNPEKENGRHCETCSVRTQCAYEMRWQPRRRAGPDAEPQDDHLGTVKKRGKVPGSYTNYRPDMCIFDSEIDIEDTYTAAIKYDKGTLVSYSVNYSLPYEGYRLAINGTRGRIETTEYHMPARVPFPTPTQTIEYFPLFAGARETIHVLQGKGGHAGGDPLILEDLFLRSAPDRPYEILAGAKAGALAVAVGEAVFRSCREGRPIKIAELLT